MTGELVAGRYRISRRLGAGGMAAVFLATDCRLEREVAIKRLHADSPEEVGQRFQREAKVGASLNHPNIVGVYDTATDDEGVLIIMEYVAGHTLRDEIGRGPIAPLRAIEILSAVASALDHAHKAGVVHRDVKPANVLIDDEGGAVKLADLGIATAAERTRITHSGAVMGTASYMAPERLDGGAGGPSVDIYALAATAFEMLSGRKAITGTTPLAIARSVATEPPPDLREVVAGAPAAAADALRRGLAKDPEERQASAGELVRQLSAAYAAQAEEEERSRRRAAAPVPVAPAAAAAAAAQPPPLPARDREFASEGREPTTAPRIHRGSRRPGWLVPAALVALLALVVAAVVLATSGGGGNGSGSSQAANSGGSAATKKPSGSSGGSSSSGAAPSSGTSDQPQQPAGGSAPDTSAGAQPAPGTTGAGGPSTPTGAVSTFYNDSANDDYQAAWALGTDSLHRELISYDSFVASQRSLQSIEFPKLEVADQSGSSATVAFSSIAHHTDRTDHRCGTIDLVKGTDGWLVDQLHIGNC
jgi:serine/threonine-protein kinase